MPRLPADLTDRAFAVRVRNKGLAPTTIERVELDLRPGTLTHSPRLPGPAAPLRLEGQSAEVFLFDAGQIQQTILASAVSASRMSGAFTATVYVGDGSSVTTNEVRLTFEHDR